MFRKVKQMADLSNGKDGALINEGNLVGGTGR